MTLIFFDWLILGLAAVACMCFGWLLASVRMHYQLAEVERQRDFFREAALDFYLKLKAERDQADWWKEA